MKLVNTTRNDSGKTITRGFASAAVLTAGIATTVLLSQGCGVKNNPVTPVHPSDTTGVDTTKVRQDTTTIYNGAPGTPLVCNVVNGPACIWNGKVVLFGNLPIKYAAGDTANPGTLQLAKLNGKLFTKVSAVTGTDTTLDLGLEKIRVKVDTVIADSGAKLAKVSVTKVCDTAELCAPTLYLDCGPGSKMTSPCIPLGTVYSFGEYAVRLDAIDLSTVTQLKAVVSVLRYNCKAAVTDTIPELKTDTLNIGVNTIYVTVNNIHVEFLPDSTGALPKTVAALDKVSSCATLTVGKDCPK